MPKPKAPPLTRDDVQDMITQAITQLAATLGHTAPADPYPRRTVVDTVGNTLKLHPSGQIEGKRPGSEEWSILYNLDGVRNILSVADIVLWPFVNAHGDPCDAIGTVKPVTVT